MGHSLIMYVKVKYKKQKVKIKKAIKENRKEKGMREGRDQEEDLLSALGRFCFWGREGKGNGNTFWHRCFTCRNLSSLSWESQKSLARFVH